MTIIIGDAKGIDSNVQRYLIKKGYENVIIYFAGELIRNNIGNWHTILCQSGYFIKTKNVSVAFCLKSQKPYKIIILF